MGLNPIGQPKDASSGNGRVMTKLVWHGGVSKKYNRQFTEAQKYVDSECLRLCSPRVPHITGNLEKSGKLGTVIGSGLIRWTAVYARKQYYDTAETRPYDANRGAKWFERMKVADKDSILEGARKKAGGG